MTIDRDGTMKTVDGAVVILASDQAGARVVFDSRQDVPDGVQGTVTVRLGRPSGLCLRCGKRPEHSRGLCGPCYCWYARRVAWRQTTWPQLIAEGKALPSRRGE